MNSKSFIIGYKFIHSLPLK